MKHIYKVINEISSHIITWGNPFNCKGQDVILCITGNPGIVDFYVEFGSELHAQTSLPVCIIGHAGHEEVPDQDKLIKWQNREDLFNLQGQINHKLDYIKNHIDKNSKLHIIGHSIGAWIVIELIDKNNFLQKKILSTNLLFPTVQKMAETKNGIYLNKIVRRLHPIIMFFAYLLPWLPSILFNFIVTCYCKFNALPASYLERIQKFFNPTSTENILLLAYNEMDTVLELNTEGLKKLCETNIIYGTKDNWAPVHYIEDMKTIQPSFQMKEVDIKHAFLLNSSERVALMVSEYISPRISKK